MDVAVEIAIGSSLQMVLFVTPSAAGFGGCIAHLTTSHAFGFFPSLAE